MNRILSRKTRIVASTTAAACITATRTGFSQNKELVEALVQNGHLTSEQASQILQPGRPHHNTRRS